MNIKGNIFLQYSDRTLSHHEIVSKTYWDEDEFLESIKNLLEEKIRNIEDKNILGISFVYHKNNDFYEIKTMNFQTDTYKYNLTGRLELLKM